jgi:hypothetical protein
MATANFAEDPRDVRAGDTPREAARAALMEVGEPYVRELAGGTTIESD